jgi:hypothetical protein
MSLALAETCGRLISSSFAIDYAEGVREKTTPADQLKMNGRLQKILRPFTQIRSLVKREVNYGLN